MNNYVTAQITNNKINASKAELIQYITLINKKVDIILHNLPLLSKKWKNMELKGIVNNKVHEEVHHILTSSKHNNHVPNVNSQVLSRNIDEIRVLNKKIAQLNHYLQNMQNTNQSN
jgi:hypothetical protein